MMVVVEVQVEEMRAERDLRLAWTRVGQRVTSRPPVPPRLFSAIVLTY